MEHTFLFSQGNWVGEGKIILGMLGEELKFRTHWNVEPRDFAGKIQCIQEIQVEGIPENMRNGFSFFDFQNRAFGIEMENQNVGRIAGTGVFDDNLIGWEFRNSGTNFEGYETYHLQPDGSYLMRGEYISTDQYRTQIEARIWLSTEEPMNEEGGAEE